MIPISKNNLEPIVNTSIGYVDSIEEFEAIELEPNQKIIRFDNFNQCFYFKERDKFGEYSDVIIYFYEDFAQKVQGIEREDFIKKCQKIGFSELKTKLAIMFFLENRKSEEVWEWTLKNTDKNYEWDTIYTMRSKMRRQLFEEVR